MHAVQWRFLPPSRRSPGLHTSIPVFAALILLGAFMSLGVLGCGGGAKQLQLQLDPINPNTCGGSEPHALWIQIYELRSDRDFQNASFDQLWEGAVETLGEDLLEDVILESVAPGRSELLNKGSFNKETTYLGIVGNFCKREGGCWKAAVPINPNDDAVYRLEITETCLALTRAR